ncbi:glycine zipper domain-containing protein [Pseudomonas nicosulfuronedens]
MEMSEKPEVLVAAVIGLGGTLGRVIVDSAMRLGTLVGKLDASLPLRILVDGIDAVQDNQDIRHRAGERNAGDARLALRRIIDLLAPRPLDIRLPKIVVSMAAQASTPANAWQRLEMAAKPLLELNSVGDVVRSSIGMTLAYRGRLMQVREAAGQPYDAAAETALSDRVVEAGHEAAMPRDKVLDLAQTLVERRVPLNDMVAMLPVAAKFAQGQGVSVETTAQLVSALQQKGDINSAADLERALSTVAWRGQKEAPSVESLSRDLLNGLQGLRPGDTQKVGSLLQARQGTPAAPPDVLNSAVDKYRDSPLGELEATEQLISGAMLGIGDTLLNHHKLLAVSAAAIAGGLLAAKPLFGGKSDIQEVFVTNWQAGCCGDLSGGGTKGKGKGKNGSKPKPGGAAQGSRGGIFQRARSILGRAAQSVRSSRVGRVAGGMQRRGAGLVRSVGASGVGRAVGGLVRRAGAGLRRFGPVSAAMAIADAASVYASDQSPAQKAVGYGKAGGSAIGAVAGAALGTLIPIPVVGTLVGGAIGATVGEWIGSKAGALFGPSEDARNPQPVLSPPVAPVAAAAVASGPPSWTFSPQVSINVAGNIVNPQQLLDELIPAMRRLIAEAQQERQRNALFDTVVM